MRFRLLCAPLLIAAACSKSAPAPEPAPAQPVETAASVVLDQDKPHLTLKTGEAPLVDKGTVEAKASGILHEGTITYVSAPLPPETGLLRTHVSGEVYALGVVTPHEDTLIVRFNSKQAPDAFDVSFEAPGDDGRYVAKGIFHITVAKNVPKRATLSKEFFDGLSEWFEAVSEVVGADGFYAYGAQRALEKSSHKVKPNDYALADIEDAMALYTGARSLRDALQAERALKLKRTGKATVAVSTLTPVVTEPHDWAKLNRELGLKAVTEPLANVVPAGMLYLHATSAGALHRTVKSLTDRLAGLVEASGMESATGDIVERYATQLGLEHSPAMSALADTAIDGIAVASSDPFFREGTDVSVVFHATNPTLLEGGLARKEQALEATRSTYKVGTHDVSLTATADGRIHRHQVRLDDVIVISNSRAAIERFVAVKDAAAPSIAAGGDFTYLRSLYPFDRSKEDAFVFVGDAFVTYVVSPAFKVASARRVFTLADEQAARYAVMYDAWLDGKGRTDAKLPQRAFGKPLVEEKVEKVTSEERDAYANFSAEYQRAWSKFIDPAAIRITNTNGALTIDARMLPITTRGEYTDIEQLAGSARVAAPVIRDGVAWVGAVGPEASLRRDLEGTGRSMMGKDFQLGWLGNWVMAGVNDRPGLYDMALASRALGEVEELQGQEGFIPPMWRAVLTHAPVFVGAEVKNPVALAAVLTGLKGMVEQAAPGLIEWTVDDAIDGQDVSIIREGAGAGAPEGQRIALRYAVVNGAFIASLDRTTLAAQIAAFKDGRGPKSASSATKPVPVVSSLDASAQTSIDYAPGVWLTKIVNALADRAARATKLRATFADEAVQPYLTGVTDEARRATLTHDLLGYTPHATDAGTLATDLAKLRRAGVRLSVEGADDHRGLHTALTLAE